MTELQNIAEHYRSRFSTEAEFFDTVMMEIQSSMIEVDDLRRERDPAMKEKIANLAALALILAHIHQLDDKQLAHLAKKL